MPILAKPIRIAFALFVAMIVLGAGVVTVQAHEGRRASAKVGVMYGKNCYYYRGTRHCSRYCYREVDGHRYCQERPELARSQAPGRYDHPVIWGRSAR